MQPSMQLKRRVTSGEYRYEEEAWGAAVIFEEVLLTRRHQRKKANSLSDSAQAAALVKHLESSPMTNDRTVG